MSLFVAIAIYFFAEAETENNPKMDLSLKKKLDRCFFWRVKGRRLIKNEEKGLF